jgi:hypothetical protein
MQLTSDDESTIAQYIRNEHPGYSGPVFICIGRLVELHMKFCEGIVRRAIISARYESKRSA